MTRRLLSDDQHGALGILVGLTMTVAPKLLGLVVLRHEVLRDVTFGFVAWQQGHRASVDASAFIM